MDALKYEPVMDTIYNIQVYEYENFNGILYLLCPLLSCGRVFFSRGHELLSLSPRRYLLSCGLDFQSQLGV